MSEIVLSNSLPRTIDPEFYYKRGVSAQNRLDFEAAVKALRKAVKLSNHRPDYCYRLAFCLEGIADFTNSHSFYQKAVANGAAPAGWHVRLATVCRKLGKTEDANQSCREAWLFQIKGFEAAELVIEGWLPSIEDLIANGDEGLFARRNDVKSVLTALQDGNRQAALDAVLQLGQGAVLSPVIWRLLGAACLVRGCARAAHEARRSMAFALVASCDDPKLYKTWTIPEIVAAACIAGRYDIADRLIADVAPEETPTPPNMMKLDRLLASGMVAEARAMAKSELSDEAKYRALFAGKTCAVVGPAANKLANGAAIDAHNIVVRTNVQDAKLIALHAKMSGKRTGVVYYNATFYRSRRERIAQYLQTAKLKSVSLRHRTANSSVARANSKLSHRIWKSYKKKNLTGTGFALRHIVHDLVLSTDSALDVYGADFYLGSQTHSAGYFEEGINVLKEYARHDVFDTFIFLKTMREAAAIRADEVLDEILAMSAEAFCLAIEDRFPAGLLSSTPASEPLKVGVLRFDYHHFKSFKEELKTKGSYSVNLGDCAQSIAVSRALTSVGVNKTDVIHIGRDSMKQYDGPSAIAIVNAVLYKHCFPMNESVQPLYFGLHAAKAVLENNLAALKAREPIGCRDTLTTNFLISHGVRAFVSGCLTLSLAARKVTPENSKVLVVYGSKAGEFPATVLPHVPPDLLGKVEFVDHRLPVWNWPLDAVSMAQVEKIEVDLLSRYAAEASLVITPLHHVAAPCMAMGIPVVLVRNAMDARFSLLERLIPIYLPESFAQIDWNPKPFDASLIRKRQHEVLARMLTAARSGNISSAHFAKNVIFDV